MQQRLSELPPVVNVHRLVKLPGRETLLCGETRREVGRSGIPGGPAAPWSTTELHRYKHEPPSNVQHDVQLRPGTWAGVKQIAALIGDCVGSVL